jgi:hypothetical protein
MARALVLELDGEEFAVSIKKIDRDQLYGSVEVEAFDEKGNPASLLILAADGKTLLDRGGTALATVDEKGNSVERSTLKAVSSTGKEIQPVDSSFNVTNHLAKAEVEDYLSQIVKSIYVIDPFDETVNLSGLTATLSEGAIYKFPFSYRGGGIEPDNGFLLGNKDGDAFMVVGKTARFQFAKLNQMAQLDSAEEQEISADDIDFDLL